MQDYNAGRQSFQSTIGGGDAPAHIRDYGGLGLRLPRGAQPGLRTRTGRRQSDRGAGRQALIAAREMRTG